LGDYDRETVRDRVSSCFPELAYYSQADEVIRKYEAEHYRDAVCSGLQFAAGDWLDAKMAYANALYYLGQCAELEADLNELEEKVDLFREVVETHGGDADAARFSSDCAYGWEAHNYETFEGVMVWGARNPDSDFNYNPALLEGELYAVSYQILTGLWLNIAWRPEFDASE
jgi:hypothetical protein